MKEFLPILIAVVGVIIGVPAILYGSAEDSPGTGHRLADRPGSRRSLRNRVP